MRRFVLTFAAFALFPAAASAHDLWIEKKAEGFVVQYGHRGGELMPIEASKLESATCIDGNGLATDLLPGASFSRKAVTLNGRCAAVSAFHHGGFHSLTPDGERNLPKNKVKDAVKSWESREYVKFVEPAGSAKTLGTGMEFVMMTDLAALKSGDKVTLRLLCDGKPVAGAAVARDHKMVGETDGDGEIRLKVKSPGLQVIDATVRRRIDSPDVDTLVMTATLCFEVPK